MPCSANGAGSSRGFWPQTSFSRPGLGAYIRSINESKKKKKEILQVLDRTKALHGPRTQAYGETKYKKEILQVLDRTKALHGPRTQAYGETKYRRKIKSFEQNQGLAWSSDSSLWGNQLLKRKTTLHEP